MLELNSRIMNKIQTLIFRRKKILLLIEKKNSHLTPPFLTPPHNVSSNMPISDARRVLGAKISSTNREIVLRFRMSSRKCHPDEWNRTAPHSKHICAEKFKHVANARDVLLEKIEHTIDVPPSLMFFLMCVKRIKCCLK